MAIAPVQFVNEAYAELKKSTWLSRSEVIGSTLVVIVLVVLMAFYVGTVDMVLAYLMGLFLGR
jgi:preprotein translocase subunit SecE